MARRWRRRRGFYKPLLYKYLFYTHTHTSLHRRSLLALHHFNVPLSNQKNLFSLDFNSMPLSIIIQRIEYNQCVVIYPTHTHKRYIANFSSYFSQTQRNRYFVAENQYLFIHYVRTYVCVSMREEKKIWWVFWWENNGKYLFFCKLLCLCIVCLLLTYVCVSPTHVNTIHLFKRSFKTTKHLSYHFLL